MPWTLCVQCCDHRFQKAGRALRRHLGIKSGHYDLISIPGGAGDLSTFQNAMALLHDKRLDDRLAVLTIHEDCAAGATETDLAKTVNAAKEFFPEVKGYILKLDGTFELIHDS